MSNFRNKSVSVHSFSMVPRADVPRSAFKVQTAHKTTFDTGMLVPVYVDEILPGDSFRLNMTAFARLATPIFPIMDNLHLESFFFFVPARLVWNNWVKFMGEQDNPGDSISYVVPKITSPASGYAVGSLFDYFGLPTVGQVAAAATVTHSVLPLRAYNLIYNEWFRDQNLQNSINVSLGDGPDVLGDYNLLRRGKRHDYFTACLPWPQKGTAVSLPLGTTAPVRGSGAQLAVQSAAGGGTQGFVSTTAASALQTGFASLPVYISTVNPSGMVADLSAATAATINQLRQAFQIQKLLERDARGGTRYIEKVKAHFGVNSPDQRQQRPEYLGGGSEPIVISPIAQTSGTGQTGQTTPLGNLAGFGTAVARGHGFTQSFTEHGYLLGLVNVRADLSYQQGLRKLWSRNTQYDFYFPVFANLGEQAVLNKEIYVRGDANDDLVFGYQERWAELRHQPSMITGLFRSTSTGTIDPWHLAQRFTSLPTLNSTFIQDTPPVSRVLAVGAAANGQQIIFDSFFDIVKARPLPTYSVPGNIDRF